MGNESMKRLSYKKQPVERIKEIERSIHNIHLLGVEMNARNVLGQENHKHIEIICALGAIQKQIDLVIEDLTIKSKDNVQM